MTTRTRRRLALHLSAGILAALPLAATALPSRADDPEVRGYALALPPLEVFDRLIALNVGPEPQFTDDERSLLAEAWELRANSASKAHLEIDDARLLDAMLFASGVDESNQREAFRKQFAELIDGAKKAVGVDNDVRQRGEKLMKFLHDGVMNKGYEESQTSFTAVFDTGQANCVSSAAMYYLVGGRLDLRLQPISIPSEGFLAGHASLDLIDGEVRVQVEPTNPDGFDWGTKSKRPGVIIIGYVPSREKGHEVDGLGVAAMIYSNRGVALSKAEPPQWLAAARCYLAALCLDPADETATNNLLAVFVNGGPALAAEKKFDEGVRLLALGQSVSPDNDSLTNNARVVWSQYIETLLDAGQDEQAKSLFGRAAKATGDAEWQNASYWYIRVGEKRLDDGWEPGLDVVERGLRLAPEADRDLLRKWRTSVFRRWSQALLDDDKDAEASSNVLARAYKLDASDENIADGIAFHTQEALRLLNEQHGVAAASEHFVELQNAFPEVEQIAEIGKSFAQSAVSDLIGDEKFNEAVAAVEQHRTFLAAEEDVAELAALAYDGWADHLAGKNKWQEALDKCAEGLKIYPDQERLINRIRIVTDSWAQPAMDDNNWDEAIRIYDIGLGYAAGDGHLKHNREYCVSMKAAR